MTSANSNVRPASPERIKAQVLALRPAAKVVEGGIGFVVVDGRDCLDSGAGGTVTTEAEAWRHAFDYLMRQMRERAGE